MHLFTVSPGDYQVTVSYPWLFASECGKNAVRLNLKAGQVKKVKYRAGLIRFLPGRMTVS